MTECKPGSQQCKGGLQHKEPMTIYANRIRFLSKEKAFLVKWVSADETPSGKVLISMNWRQGEEWQLSPTNFPARGIWSHPPSEQLHQLPGDNSFSIVQLPSVYINGLVCIVDVFMHPITKPIINIVLFSFYFSCFKSLRLTAWCYLHIAVRKHRLYSRSSWGYQFLHQARLLQQGIWCLLSFLQAPQRWWVTTWTQPLAARVLILWLALEWW